MTPEPTFYTIEELAAQTGIKERNIRYYIAEGLMHPPTERGRYDASHLVRLRFVRKLSEEYVRLDQIRKQLERYSDAEIAAILTEETAAGQKHSRQSPEPTRSRRENLMDYLRQVQEPNAPREPLLPDVKRRSSPKTPQSYSLPPPSAEWERYPLADGVELHARKPVLPEQQRLLDALFERANAINLGKIQEEEDLS